MENSKIETFTMEQLIEKLNKLEAILVENETKNERRNAKLRENTKLYYQKNKHKYKENYEKRVRQKHYELQTRKKYNLLVYNTDMSKGDIKWHDKGDFPTYKSIAEFLKKDYPFINEDEILKHIKGYKNAEYPFIKITNNYQKINEIIGVSGDLHDIPVSALGHC
jgi:hypothetical protein